MKGDFTRKSFRKKKHYRSVNIQQGRVQTDAEPNEQNDIQFHYERTFLQDIIGKSGTKGEKDEDGRGCGDGGFEILPNPQVCSIDDPKNDELNELKTFIRNNFALYWIGEEQHFTKSGNMFQISQGSHTAKIKLQRDDKVAILEIDGKEVYKFIVVGNGIYSRGYIVGAGNYYLDGILCENEFPIDVSLQQDLRISREAQCLDYRKGINYSQENNPALIDITTNQTSSSYYLVYVHQWQKHVTSNEDSFIQETALGDIDTATRTKIAWQIKLIDIDEVEYKRRAEDNNQKWEKLIRQKNPDATGKMKARVNLGTDSLQNPDRNPYQRSGYQKLQNQLYRVEVHDQGEILPDRSGKNESPTFKWSRDNGVVVSKILSFHPDNRQIIIERRGRDRSMDFAKDQYVEITDDLHEDLGVPGTFVRLSSVRGNTLEYDINSVIGQQPLTPDSFSSNPKVRRWESTSDGPLIKPPPTTTSSQPYIALEEGIEIQFSEGYYRTGDYWNIPARASIQNIEWPSSDDNEESSNSNDPLAILPTGIDDHYSPLAIIRRDSNGLYEIIKDLRICFSSLTDIYNRAEHKGTYFATSGIAVLQLPSEEDFTYPLIFGPFTHNLNEIDTPPSIHLGSYLDERNYLDGPNIAREPKNKEQESSEGVERKNEYQSYNIVPITEDFPGAPLVFKPIVITRTNFYILLAKHDKKDPLGTFSKLSDFISTLDISSDDDYSDDDYDDDDPTNQVADDDSGKTSYSQDLSQTSDNIQDIGGTLSRAQTMPEVDTTTTDRIRIRIHWWAIPAHYTGEQPQSAINLGSRPTIRTKTAKGRKKR